MDVPALVDARGRHRATDAAATGPGRDGPRLPLQRLTVARRASRASAWPRARLECGPMLARGIRSYHRPNRLEEALDLAAQGVVPLAGGTRLLASDARGPQRPRPLRPGAGRDRDGGRRPAPGRHGHAAGRDRLARRPTRPPAGCCRRPAGRTPPRACSAAWPRWAASRSTARHDSEVAAALLALNAVFVVDAPRRAAGEPRPALPEGPRGGPRRRRPADVALHPGRAGGRRPRARGRAALGARAGGGGGRPSRSRATSARAPASRSPASPARRRACRRPRRASRARTRRRRRPSSGAAEQVAARAPFRDDAHAPAALPARGRAACSRAARCDRAIQPGARGPAPAAAPRAAARASARPAHARCPTSRPAASS